MTDGANDDQIGRVLGGRYRLIACIGGGASARVYLADDTTLRRRVAVKILHPSLASDSTFLRRFRAEAQAAAALNHPHILAVHDWGYDDGPYLVTEYLGGGSLRAMLDAGHRLSPSQTLMVGLEAARGLDHAHRQGFVHRDIKPANLLFDEEARLRIADFGLARALAEASITEPTGAVLGTYRYASPEQAKGEPVDQRSDVYALALVLCEAVTGTVPFAADTSVGTLMARIDEPLVPPTELGPLRSAVGRAGNPDPEQRPTAGELAIALMAVAESLPRPRRLPLVGTQPVAGSSAGGDRTVVAPVVATTTAEGPEAEAEAEAEPAATRRRRRRWPWVLLTLVVLAAAGVGGYLAWQQVTATPTHDIPELRGTAEAEATAALEELGFEVARAEGRDDEIAEGDVIETSPVAGTSVEEGETVTVVVSLGKTLVGLPDVAGTTPEEAAARLTEAGLVAGPVTPTFDEVVPPGQVIGLDVPVGTTELPRDSTVGVLVSQGPAPRTVPAEVVGSSYDEAAALLAESRLVAAREDACSDTVPDGLVVSSDPEAGAELPADATVTLTVASGPCPIEVPDVVGLSVSEADAVLADAGFDVQLNGDLDGTVFGQRPSAGTLAPPGSTVTIAA